MANIMAAIQDLIAQIHAEAQREEFPLDRPVYESAGLDPTAPILYAGNLASQLCIFARDLGKDEVSAQQPLYGAAGRLVRQGLYRAMFHQEPTSPTDLQKVCDRVLLTNTVPYKPPGNKAYSTAVKKRFRPFLEQLLVEHWQGDRIITLGNEAFEWFTPYGKKGELSEFFCIGDRYTASIEVTLPATNHASITRPKIVTLMPLPHPSPLNQKYYAQFPQLLAERLKNLRFDG
ncbi:MULTISPECIES: uracil-DNA glycosylase family protein [Planktothricoides]|uniref:Uracil-DNA glycosylase family protein n=2 Tax=Planktothricoides raciborskii TaxID=132608 RepID=A0AAU8JJQ8_9CYAN|nr:MULTISPECIES: uracil-DNA glycosylase family protein [Planktothricoides]